MHKSEVKNNLYGLFSLKMFLMPNGFIASRFEPLSICLKKKSGVNLTSFFARSTGLEPVASTVTGWRDNQLHQDPKCIMKLQYSLLFVNNPEKKTKNLLLA